MAGLPIVDFLQELVLTPVAVQRKFDAAYLQDVDAAIEAAAPLVSILGPDIWDALRTARMVARQTSLRVSIEVRRTRMARFGLSVYPLGLGFAVLSQTETMSSSHVTIAVEQIPLGARTEEALNGQ